MEDKLNRLDAEVRNHAERIGRLEVRQAVAEAGITELKDDISTIKSDTRWILRLIIGAMVTGVIGGAITLVFQALQN